MARTPVLTKEQIIDTAYDILNTEGFDNVTIRNIASKLDKSTAPIYTQYKSIDDIFKDLADCIRSKVFDYTSRQWTPDGFLDIGVGLIAFTLENPGIFRHYFMQGNAYIKGFKELTGPFLERMKTMPFNTLFDENILAEILSNMSTYTYGLAATACLEGKTPDDLPYYIEDLGRTGQKIMHYHILTSGKYEQFLQLITNGGLK